MKFDEGFETKRNSVESVPRAAQMCQVAVRIALDPATGIEAGGVILVAMDIAPLPDSIADRTAPISRQIWDVKYRCKAADGRPLDLTVEDSQRGVARSLAASVSV